MEGRGKVGKRGRRYVIKKSYEALYLYISNKNQFLSTKYNAA